MWLQFKTYNNITRRQSTTDAPRALKLLCQNSSCFCLYQNQPANECYGTWDDWLSFRSLQIFYISFDKDVVATFRDDFPLRLLCKFSSNSCGTLPHPRWNAATIFHNSPTAIERWFSVAGTTAWKANVLCYTLKDNTCFAHRYTFTSFGSIRGCHLSVLLCVWHTAFWFWCVIQPEQAERMTAGMGLFGANK